MNGLDTNDSTSTELKKFKTDAKFPGLVPNSIEDLYNLSKKYDTSFYNNAEADILKRHPEVPAIEQSALSRALADQKGNSTLMPAVQNALLTSGLQGASASLGDLGTSLELGSAGEAALGRHIAGPEGIAGMQELDRKHATDSLGMVEALFPRRQIGFGGETAAGLKVGNTENRNIYKMGRYMDEFGRDKTDWLIDAQNQINKIQQSNVDAQAGATDAASKSAADAQKRQAMIAGGAALAGAIIIAF